MATRVLAWDGCVNVRDLGGVATEDGGVTRFGAIVRSDSVRQLTDAGWASLVDHGVRRVVDLRWHEELAGDPPRELPVETVHVSLFGRFDEAYGAELDASVAHVREAAERVRRVYGALLERNRPHFATAVAAIAEAPDGAVVFHCAAGKDRTGLVAALLLRVAGATEDAVADDYAATRPALDALHARWFAEALDEEERQRRRELARDGVPREAMLGVLADLQERFGGVEEFLRGAGLGAVQLRRIRSRLRDGA